VATTPVDRAAFGYLADAAARLGHALDARDALIDLDALQGDTASPDERAARALRIGSLSLDANDPRTAVAYLDDAYTGGHRDAATLGLLARARWLTGDTEAARTALRQALRLEPDDPALLGLARTLNVK
jgi:tetratricopeptide (TPR) repeat protein